MATLASILESIIVRAPWLAVARPMILSAGFDVKRGAGNTVNAALSAKPPTDAEKKLARHLTEHLVSGEKYVRLVRLNPGERQVIRAWISGKRVNQTPLTNAFPGVASRRDIIDALGTLASCGHVETKNGIAALYTGGRSYVESVVLPKSDLKQNAADYEKVVGYRTVYTQTYEAIWLPDGLDVLCLATDFPEQAGRGFCAVSQDALKGEVQKQLKRSIPLINFWGAVEGIYSTPGGRLVDYGFANSNDAVKHHKGRQGKRCLRDDVYDKAGAAAVGDDLKIFKLAMRWDRVRKDLDNLCTEPEIMLPGTYRMIYEANASLDHAIIRGCFDTDDFAFVLGKLMAHV